MIDGGVRSLRGFLDQMVLTATPDGMLLLDKEPAFVRISTLDKLIVTGAGGLGLKLQL